MGRWVDSTNYLLLKKMSNSKRVLVIRLGAYGDMIIISPVLTRLKELGYYVMLNTGERGSQIYQHDNRVDKIIKHDESLPIEKVSEHWDKLKKEIKHDLFINFSESIECNVALHPKSPMYIYPKKERIERCNRNYYDVSNEWSKLEGCKQNPSLQFTEEEEKKVKSYIKKDHYNILWALSGSGKQKAYPWTDYVMGEVLKTYKDAHIITVGDNKCQILENIGEFPEDRTTNLAGRIPIREAFLLTKYVDLVVSPDTGTLHASGCYGTPKIGLLGHTTIENITKHFHNDFSIESKCECAPCFHLVYDYEVQCPIDEETKAAWCMARITPKEVFEKIKKVREVMAV